MLFFISFLAFLPQKQANLQCCVEVDVWETGGKWRFPHIHLCQAQSLLHFLSPCLFLSLILPLTPVPFSGHQNYVATYLMVSSSTFLTQIKPIIRVVWVPLNSPCLSVCLSVPQVQDSMKLDLKVWSGVSYWPDCVGLETEQMSPDGWPCIVYSSACLGKHRQSRCALASQRQNHEV